MKQLLLGDEAIALGALHAGISGVYAYPGTPSTEITEFIQRHPLTQERGIHSRWSTNEKTAMEAALGMSYAGKRALVCMKHVGMNVCADAFINSAITGANGGLVVVAADDPSMHSSQNEQDSRFYGKFALVPIFEPSNQQECYDMMAKAFELSEKVKEPVLLRIVTRLAHSRAAVEIGEVRDMNALNPTTDQWVLLPAISRKRYAALIEKQMLIQEDSENSVFNRAEESMSRRIEESKNRRIEESNLKTSIIACGIAYNYVKEIVGDTMSVLKISQYPLPENAIKALAEKSERLLVVEDGQPVVEEAIHALLGADYPVLGRLTGELPRTGELNPDHVAKALESRRVEESKSQRVEESKSQRVEESKSQQVNESKSQRVVPECVAARPPQLCQGCGHRDVYAALRNIIDELPDARVFGDIGCYTLGALPPYKAMSSNLDMGASIPMAKGAADAGFRPSIAIIGDSTFTHSGMTGLLDAINENTPITVIISDNLSVAMTGGQEPAGKNRIEEICLGLGMNREHLHLVNPMPANIPAITQLLRDEIAYKGLSVIIPRRECVQSAKRQAVRRTKDEERK